MEKPQAPREQFTTAKIRELCREGFLASTPHIIGIAKGESEHPTDQTAIRAHDNLGKYAIGHKAEILIGAREWMEVVLKVTSEFLTDQETFEKWWAQILVKLEEHS